MIYSVLLKLSLFIFDCLKTGVLKRCFQCRSRGELGNCKDPFTFNNATAIEKVPGIQAVPCASGWCGKILEGGANQFKDEGLFLCMNLVNIFGSCVVYVIHILYDRAYVLNYLPYSRCSLESIQIAWSLY